MSLGPPQPYLRASDDDREKAVERLHRAAVDGRLDADELEERTAAAYAARWTSDLDRLTADVTPVAHRPVPLPPPIRYPSTPPVPTRTVNGLAVASLVAGCMVFSLFAAICAVIFGHAARRQVSRSQGRQKGDGMAIAGIVLGYLGIAVHLVILAVALS